MCKLQTSKCFLHLSMCFQTYSKSRPTPSINMGPRFPMHCCRVILKWFPRRKWVPRNSHMSHTRKRVIYRCKKDLYRHNVIKLPNYLKKIYNYTYVSINRSFSETRPSGQVYTILWRNLWAPPFLYHVICRHWGADNCKLVHYSVLRLRVYFWLFHLTNIDVIDQKNSSYQAEFNSI